MDPILVEQELYNSIQLKCPDIECCLVVKDSWNFTKFQGISRDLKRFQGILWDFMGFYGILCDFNEFEAISRAFIVI